MYRKMVAVMVNALAIVVVFVAYIGVSVNCIHSLYEPDIPESLKLGDI